MSLQSRLKKLEQILGGPNFADAGSLVIDGDVTADVFIGNLKPNLHTPAAAGSVIGNATLVTAGINAVTGADDAKGIKLPPASDGQPVIVLNTVANKILKVYPQDGNGTINALSAGAAISMGNGTSAMFVPTGNTTYMTLPKLPS